MRFYPQRAKTSVHAGVTATLARVLSRLGETCQVATPVAVEMGRGSLERLKVSALLIENPSIHHPEQNNPAALSSASQLARVAPRRHRAVDLVPAPASSGVWRAAAASYGVCGCQFIIHGHMHSSL